MARNQDADADEKPEANADAGSAADAEEADGYRPTRKQLLAQKADEGAESGAKKPTKDDEEIASKGQKPGRSGKGARPPSEFDAFIEKHWEAWLRPVLLIAGLGFLILGYQTKILPESFVALCATFGVLVAAIYTTAWPAADMIGHRTWRSVFFGVVVVWAFSSGYPLLRKIKPREVLGRAVLTEANREAKVQITGSTGPFDIVVGGDLDGGSQEARADYEVTVTSSGVTETVRGELTYSVNQTRSRRGGSRQWKDLHNQVTHSLPRNIAGKELSVATENVDTLLKDGLYLQFHPADPFLRVLFPFKILGKDVPVLGLLVVLLMVFVETRIGDSLNKTHLVMASMITMIFTSSYVEDASSPSNLARPVISAGFSGVILGGIGGSFFGWLSRHLSGRSKIKAPEERDKERAGGSRKDD